MSDLGWRAEGLRLARECGGVDLELKRRPGFTGGIEVRVANNWPSGGSGMNPSDPYTDEDPMPDWTPPTADKPWR